ncbi:uncharacterized protein [Porites lutea]|uniref:uncharacterized protein n=1 Tax=Porites lutea TaxID=51062 RepID=UPI003CC5B018
MAEAGLIQALPAYPQQSRERNARYRNQNTKQVNRMDRHKEISQEIRGTIQRFDQQESRKMPLKSCNYTRPTSLQIESTWQLICSSRGDAFSSLQCTRIGKSSSGETRTSMMKNHQQ